MKIRAKATINPEFTLRRFDEILEINRFDSQKNEKGHVYLNDVIVAPKDLIDYLVENNAVQILEVLEEQPIVEKIVPIKEKSKSKIAKKLKK